MVGTTQGHNSGAALRAFEHHHAEAERLGKGSLDHRMKAAKALWEEREATKHSEWEPIAEVLPCSRRMVTYYLLAGEFLASGQNRQIGKDCQFDDFAHLLLAAGDWRAARDAEEARRAAQEAREREAEARRDAEAATRAKERERAQRRAEREAATVAAAEQRADEQEAKVARRRSARAELDGVADQGKEAPRFNESRPSSNEWYTPKPITDAARLVMGGIDLDPASCPVAQERIQAATWHGIDDDGLAQDWSGRVWLNPPYSAQGDQAIAHWIRKLLAAVEDGSVPEAVMLLNNTTDTKAGNAALKACEAACFACPRIAFEGPLAKQGMPVGQVVYYYGPSIAAFVDRFNQFGVVVAPVREVITP